MPEPLVLDPLERLWSHVFAGDAGLSHRLVATTAGARLIEHRPDGGTRTVTVADPSGPTFTFEVPTTTPLVLAGPAPLADLADIADSLAISRGRAFLGVGVGRAPAPIDAIPQGTLAEVLSAHGSPVARLVAQGADVTCPWCAHAPALSPPTGPSVSPAGDPSPCALCAGTRLRRSAGTVTLTGVLTGTVEVAAATVAVARQRLSHTGKVMERTALDLAPLTDQLGDIVPPEGLLLDVDGVAVVAGRYRWRGDSPEGLLCAFWPLVPGPTRHGTSPDPAAGQVAFDAFGRVAHRRVEAHPRRLLAAWWDELVSESARRAGPDESVEVHLGTGFIATGQYGPTVAAVARDAAGTGRPLVRVDAGGSLESTVASAVFALRRARSGRPPGPPA